MTQTKHFNIPSIYLPIILSHFSASCKSCSGCPKNITITWCTTAAKVNSDKWQPDLNQNLISPFWWRIKTSASLLRFCRSHHFHRSQEFSAFTSFYCNAYCSYKLFAWMYRPTLMTTDSGPNCNFLQTVEKLIVQNLEN